MIVLYTIYSNIQQYALIDEQLNEKTHVTDKNTQKPRRHQKNPDLVEKTQLWQHCRLRSTAPYMPSVSPLSAHSEGGQGRWDYSEGWRERLKLSSLHNQHLKEDSQRSRTAL